MGSIAIAKNQNTFAKRQREMEKKRKAEEKRDRRVERKAAPKRSPMEMADDNPDPFEDDDLSTDDPPSTDS